MTVEVPTRKPPPRRKPGMGKGPRVLNGAVLDVRNATLMLGGTEKRTRGQVSRHLIPFRQWGGRIVFLRTELEQWLASLPGCSLAEAQANLQARKL